jgi:hypothetical protein
MKAYIMLYSWITRMHVIVKIGKSSDTLSQMKTQQYTHQGQYKLYIKL